MGAGVMQQPQGEAAKLWGRSSPPIPGPEQGPDPVLGTLLIARADFWPSSPSPLPLMHLPSWSMHGGPRAVAAPSPPFPSLPSRACHRGRSIPAPLLMAL